MINFRGIEIGRENYKIFSGGKIAGLSLKNRLVRSATYEACMTPEGRLTDEMLSLYKSLAQGGVGMIITGHMAVTPLGKVMEKQTCIYDDVFMEEIAPVAEAVHSFGKGCKVIAQLSHGGRQVQHDNDWAECVGPSDVPCPILKKKPRSLSAEEIRDIVRSFAEAIERVKKAGYDGAQLHAAHGWLLSSFLSPHTNHRTDEYGGSVGKRVKILREIAARARDKVGEFPMLAKINSDDNVVGGIGIDTFPEFAAEVESAGFDAVEVSGGMWDCLVRTEAELGFRPVPIPEAHTRINSPEKQSYFLKYTENLDLGIPVILVGGNRNIERMEEILNSGRIDFFSMARPLISEPDLPDRWKEGKGGEGTDCVSCNSCLLPLRLGQPVHCMLKKSRFQQRLVKNVTPHVWKLMLR